MSENRPTGAVYTYVNLELAEALVLAGVAIARLTYTPEWRSLIDLMRTCDRWPQTTDARYSYYIYDRIMARASGLCDDFEDLLRVGYVTPHAAAAGEPYPTRYVANFTAIYTAFWCEQEPLEALVLRITQLPVLLHLRTHTTVSLSDGIFLPLTGVHIATNLLADLEALLRPHVPILEEFARRYPQAAQVVARHAAMAALLRIGIFKVLYPDPHHKGGCWLATTQNGLDYLVNAPHVLQATM